MRRLVMRIGLDIDNVISTFNDDLLEEFLKHNKELGYSDEINENADYITKGMFNWKDEEIKVFYKDTIERIVSKLNVKSGAKEYIDKLKEEGHLIYTITGRNNEDLLDPYNTPKKWLDGNLIYYDKLILTKYDKHEKSRKCIENNIDIMIDDSSDIALTME